MATQLTTGFFFSWDSTLSVSENIQNWRNFIQLFNLHQYSQIQYSENGVERFATVEELTNEFQGLEIENEYTEVDETWPSRRWNKDHTDYIDLSGV